MATVISPNLIDQISRAPDIILQDQKSSATAGGSSSAGVNIRVLNTEVRDVNGDCSLSSNQFTLSTGSYYVEWSAPSHRGNNNQTYIYNATDATEEAFGVAGYSISTSDYADSRSNGWAVISVGTSKALELRHDITTAKATNGLGVQYAGGRTLIYGEVRLWRLS